jgi:acetyl-CoA synthetase
MKTDITPGALVERGLSPQAANDILTGLERIPDRTAADEAWSVITREILTRDIPFAVHLLLYETVYRGWDSSEGPPPAWLPTREEIEGSNIAALCRKHGLRGYPDLYKWSCDRRSQFWSAVIESLEIRFASPPSETLDISRGLEAPDWLPGARLNIADSCFQASGESPAIVYQAEDEELRTMTYDELDALSNRVANSLSGIGLSKGDPMAIAMPMTVEAVAAYMGIVKAGCVVVSIADSFSSEEIATRLRISGAKTVLTQDVILRGGKTIPMYQRVADAGAAVAIVIPAGEMVQVTLRDADREWRDFLAGDESFENLVCYPSDPVNILFSSGTTGDPKAIPWTHTTPIKCAMDGLLHQNIKPGDVVAWPTNIGWMMGPWLIFASLLNRATIALHYGAPNTREFCVFVQDAKVQMLGVVPSLVKVWRAIDAVDGLDWSAIKVFSSTGEASNARDYLYLMSLANYRPVIEYCGGTEIGGGYVSGTVVQPASPSTFSTPSLGLVMYLLDEDAKEAVNGEVFLVPPSIGLSTSLLNRDHHEVYFADTPKGPKGETLRRHGDQMEWLDGGYSRCQGRADDTMNLGGIKVSSAEIERAVSGVDGLVETAAIAFDPPDGGPSLLVIYAVRDPGVSIDAPALRMAMHKAISKNLNPLFKIHDVVTIDALPRTASNKVMRRVLRDRYVEEND